VKLTLKQFFGYLSPRCLYGLLRRRLWRSKNPGVPWLTQQAVEILDGRLKPSDIGLEWGSGRSTVWLAQRVAHLTSIEHDERWYKRVKKALYDMGADNVDLLYAPLEAAEEGQPEYIRIAAEQKKASLDFIFIDGRLRDQCAEVAMHLIKPGGMLIIDDAARYIQHSYCCPQSVEAQDGPPTALWSKIASELKAMEAETIWTSDGVTATVFYIIPPKKASG